MKALYVVLIALLLMSCEEQGNDEWKAKSFDIEVWNDAGLEFIVLIDNPNACQDQYLYDGLGPFSYTLQKPDWGTVNLIAQLKNGNCDTIYMMVNDKLYFNQITIIIPLQ